MMKAVFFSTSLLCWNGNKKRLDIKRSAAHALILSTLLDKLEYNICQVQNKKEEREREREREREESVWGELYTLGTSISHTHVLLSLFRCKQQCQGTKIFM